MGSCNCKNGATGATGAAGAAGEHSIADFLHIVNALPTDPLPGELYFVQSENAIYMGDQRIFGEVPEVESFAFTVQTDDGTFLVPVKKDNSGGGIPYNWTVYLDDIFYTTTSGVSSSSGSTVAATITGLDTAPHVIRIEPVPDVIARTVPNGWLVAFGQLDEFDESVNAQKITYCNSKISKTSIAANDTTIADSALESLFFSASNLVLGPDFGFSNRCNDFTGAGNYVAQSMLAGCAAIPVLPSDFNLPQNLTRVGDFFAAYMLSNCSGLSALPNGFNLPQNITSVGDYFASSLLDNCSSLVSLPSDFNLPQNLTQVGSSFAGFMLSYCTGIAALPDGFNLPQSITSANDDFATGMFQGCGALTKLPDDFNLPQNLTHVDTFFAAYLMYHCTSLTALPSGFNFPQSLMSAGDFFATSMLENCSNLIVDDALQLVNVFALGASTAYNYCFRNLTRMQNRTAASIIYSLVPSYRTYAFSGATGFNDYATIPTNWK